MISSQPYSIPDKIMSWCCPSTGLSYCPQPVLVFGLNLASCKMQMRGRTINIGYCQEPWWSYLKAEVVTLWLYNRKDKDKESCFYRLTSALKYLFWYSKTVLKLARKHHVHTMLPKDQCVFFVRGKKREQLQTSSKTEADWPPLSPPPDALALSQPVLLILTLSQNWWAGELKLKLNKVKIRSLRALLLLWMQLLF